MWLKDSNGNRFTDRMSVAVDNSGGSAGTIDWTMTIPAFADSFWTDIRSSAQDLRVTAADGCTLLTFEAASFNSTTRTVTLEVDNDTAEAGAVLQRWVYWGNADVSSVSTTVAPAGTIRTGYLELGRPTYHQVKVRPERPDSTRWQGRIQKSSTEQIWVFFDVREALQYFLDAFGKKHHYEEVVYATYEVLAGASAQAAMVDATSTRFLDGWVRVLVKAGSSGTTYTLSLTIVTTLGRTLNPRCGIVVRNVSEE